VKVGLTQAISLGGPLVYEETEPWHLFVSRIRRFIRRTNEHNTPLTSLGGLLVWRVSIMTAGKSGRFSTEGLTIRGGSVLGQRWCATCRRKVVPQNIKVLNHTPVWEIYSSNEYRSWQLEEWAVWQARLDYTWWLGPRTEMRHMSPAMPFCRVK
jgi:hypothetical protein